MFISFFELSTNVSLFILLYVYCGYLFLLKLLNSWKGDVRCDNGAELTHSFKVTVLVTAFNEETVIRERIDNILGQSYPSEKLDILIASDGSTDSTDLIVSDINNPRVRLFSSKEGRGKTATQNEAFKLIDSELVVFTDAGSRFDKDFVRNIVSVFSNPSVGAAVGHLLFEKQISTGLAKSQGYYWTYELALRQEESRLGLLAVGSGACLAVRRKLVLEMDPSIGEDCIVPLDIVTQKHKVLHVAEAVAYDAMDRDYDSELITRIRMTLRNWQGTFSRKQLLNPFMQPKYAFALWSHKILRWLSPFFLIVLTFSASAGAFSEVVYLQVILGFLLIFYFGALIGWLAYKLGWKVPLASSLYSFLVANIGFFVGVSLALLGRRLCKYR